MHTQTHTHFMFYDLRISVMLSNVCNFYHQSYNKLVRLPYCIDIVMIDNYNKYMIYF